MPKPSYHGGNLVGGDILSAGASTYTATDPSSGSILPGNFHEATDAEIDRAVTLADEAWQASSEGNPDDRAGLLEHMADEIERLGDDLVERVVAETGLGEGRVRGERGRTTGQLRLFAELVREGSWVDARIDPGDPKREPTPKPDVRRMRMPLGPVAVFGASNFPLAFSVAGGDTASAIAAGCPVIVKAHPAHPGTSELVGEALRRAVGAAGFHPGTFSMIHGRDPDVIMALVRHPLLRAIGFTGSLHAGRAIFDAAAARPRPIPVYAEMGSVNPVFLLRGALKERPGELADGLVGSVTLGAGQFCTNPGVVFGLDSDDLDDLIDTISEELGKTSAFTMLHRGICDAYVEGLERLSGVEGVQVAGRAEAGGGRAGAAVLTVSAEVFSRTPQLHEEVFGPSTLVVRCSDLEEMDRVAAALGGNLTATLHGTDEDLLEAKSLMGTLRRRVGRLIFNGFPTGVEVGHAMQHGGPYPATTDERSTSVGTAAVERFARPICYQDFPQDALPAELRDRNERGIWRRIDGSLTQANV